MTDNTKIWVCTCGRGWRSSQKHTSCPHCGRPCHYPADSTPPETPFAIKQRRPESLLPPRAMPQAGVSAVFIALASAVAADDRLPLEKRCALVALFALLAWLFGYFTQPPRRRFRRDDP